MRTKAVCCAFFYLLLVNACGDSGSDSGDSGEETLSTPGSGSTNPAVSPNPMGGPGDDTGGAGVTPPSTQTPGGSASIQNPAMPAGGEGAGGDSGSEVGSGGEPGAIPPSGSGGQPGNDGTDAAGGSDAAGSGGETGEGAGGSGPVSDVPAGAISDLTIEPNPNSVLSAHANWTTAEPGTSVVQFGIGDLTLEIEDPAPTTEHRVLIVGMRAESTYDIRALSVTDAGTLQGDATFTTGTLPDQIPVAMVNTLDASKMQPGWNLMHVQQGNGTERALSGAPPAAVVYDEEGQPVWYYIHGTQTERGGAISCDLTDRGVILGPADTAAPVEVDWAGNVLWTCSNTTCGTGGALSHHADKLSNGNYIIQRDGQFGGRISQVYEELTADNQMVHSIGLEDLVTPPAGASGDWAHGNAITVDLENDIAYISFRWLGVMKAVYSERRLLWHLPASYGAEGMGDMTFVPPESQFTDIHDPEIHDDGQTILFFDNGGWTGQVAEGNPAGLQTRIVEYAIDEEAKTATLTWEFPGTFDVDPWYTEDFYVPFWGDADRLENGNILVTAGRRGVTEATPQSRIFEVTKEEGEVVWEFLLPRDFGLYRSDRIQMPLVRRIGEP